MSDLIANVVGSAAALCSITSFAPQMIKIWKERDASAVRRSSLPFPALEPVV